MEEGCLLSLINRKQGRRESMQRGRRISEGLQFPIYIITQSYQSKHLSALQQLLEKEHIALAFQKQLDQLQKIPNTYNKSFFIVFNDYTDPPVPIGEFKNIQYQSVNYPETPSSLLLAKYRQFVQTHIKPSEVGVITGSKQTMGSQQGRAEEEESDGKTKIKLKSVSKLLFSYKSAWPKRLFIYCNRRDQSKYRTYIAKLKQMSFDNAIFIDQIQDYIRQLPSKGDVSFCVLMGEYSAINLRKFFKKTDEMLLLGENKDNCLPLLRGKVTYFTTEYESMDLILGLKFGMKKRQLLSVHLNIDNIEQGMNAQSERHSLPILGSEVGGAQTKILEGRPCSSALNFKIVQQFSLLNEPTKELFIQSNLISLNISPEKSPKTQAAELIAAQIQTPTKQEDYSQAKKQQILCEFKKISPLRVVQLEAVSIANTCLSSSEIAERQAFQQLFDKFNFQQLQFNPQQENCLQMSRRNQITDIKQHSKENISGFSEGGTHSSRFSGQNSYNSRILSRIKQCGKVKRKIIIDNQEAPN